MHAPNFFRYRVVAELLAEFARIVAFAVGLLANLLAFSRFSGPASWRNSLVVRRFKIWLQR